MVGCGVRARNRRGNATRPSPSLWHSTSSTHWPSSLYMSAFPPSSLYGRCTSFRCVICSTVCPTAGIKGLSTSLAIAIHFLRVPSCLSLSPFAFSLSCFWSLYIVTHFLPRLPLISLSWFDFSPACLWSLSLSLSRFYVSASSLRFPSDSCIYQISLWRQHRRKGRTLQHWHQKTPRRKCTFLQRKSKSWNNIAKKNPFEKGLNQSRIWTLEYRRIFPLHLVSAIHGIACLVHTARLTGFTIAATSRKKKRSGFPTLKSERLGNFVSKIATLCGIRKEQLAVRFGVKLKLEQNW